MKSLFVVVSLFSTLAYAEESISTPLSVEVEKKLDAPAVVTAFSPFTGRVSANRVRLRTKPQIDSPVVKELKAGDLFVINGETDEFYSVTPPRDVKLFINRKYVLDNVVDGSRVNVRLSPNVDAPVITQMQAGDKVEGTLVTNQPKWLEISPPSFVQFYIAKDYIDRLGGPELLLKLQKQKEHIDQEFATASAQIQSEMQKSFELILIDQALGLLENVSEQEKDFPKEAASAKKLLADTRDAYLKKKIHYLESVTKDSSDQLLKKNEELRNQISEQQKRVQDLEDKAKKREQLELQATTKNGKPTAEMIAWESNEELAYRKYLATIQENKTLDQFYNEELANAEELTGIIQPYSQNLSQRPGDYLLFSEKSGTPIAYLYSTKVNLKDHVGEKVTIRGTERPNRNFAFPAYFVLSLEK